MKCWNYGDEVGVISVVVVQKPPMNDRIEDTIQEISMNVSEDEKVMVCGDYANKN